MVALVVVLVLLEFHSVQVPQVGLVAQVRTVVSELVAVQARYCTS